jgi:hypothetical protein
VLPFLMLVSSLNSPAGHVVRPGNSSVVSTGAAVVRAVPLRETKIGLCCPVRIGQQGVLTLTNPDAVIGAACIEPQLARCCFGGCCGGGRGGWPCDWLSSLHPAILHRRATHTKFASITKHMECKRCLWNEFTPVYHYTTHWRLVGCLTDHCSPVLFARWYQCYSYRQKHT